MQSWKGQELHIRVPAFYKEQPNICLPLGQLLLLFIPKCKFPMFQILPLFVKRVGLGEKIK